MKLKLPKSPYKDILTICAGLLVFYLLAHKALPKQIFLYSSVSIAIASLLSEFIANKIVLAWYKLAEGMGFISSRVILSLIFFLFLTPIAFLSRFKKQDALHLKKSPGSYFTKREHLYTKKDLEKMW